MGSGWQSRRIALPLRKARAPRADKTYLALETKSRWAQMARSGKRVMQFLSEGRYVANVVDAKVNFYGRRPGTSR
jgi:hypothetical protein